MINPILNAFLWIVAAMWLIGMLKITIDVLSAQLLPRHRLPGEYEITHLSVSVVVPARDEAARIEHTVRRLLAQEGVDIEVIVVDDRSVDDTGEMLRQLMSETPRLKVLRVDQLPKGWLGKCHACHLGGAAATGDWILFADGDVWMKPDTIARAVAAAVREGADHVCLTPGFCRSPTTLARAAMLVFGMILAGHAMRVNRDRRNAYFGVGAFNLVRAKTYRAIGGHEGLRLEIIDDLRLGQLLRRAGARTRVYVGNDDIEVDWADDVRGIIRVLEKNSFAQLRFNTTLVVLALLINLSFQAAAIAGPFTGTPAGFAAAVAYLSLIVPATVLAVKQRWSILSALLAPIGFLILLAALVNSTIVTLRQGGIRWRDTFYPLTMLREGMVR